MAIVEMEDAVIDVRDFSRLTMLVVDYGRTTNEADGLLQVDCIALERAASLASKAAERVFDLWREMDDQTCPKVRP